MKRFIIICFSFYCASCASPQKHFKNGNFEKAYEQALKQLTNNKADRKDKQILNKSFNELLKEYHHENTDYLSSDLIEDWEEAYGDSQILIDQYQRGRRYLDEINTSDAKEVERESVQLKSDIAQNYYSLANESMLAYGETGDKRAAQDAYLMYSKVDIYADNNLYPELDFQMQESLREGTIKILVVTESWEINTEWEIDQEFDDIEREWTGDFIQIFYKRNEGDIDCRIELDFSRLDVDDRVRNTTENFNEEIIDGYQTVTDTSGVSTQQPIYRTVSGSVRIETIERSYRWSARATIDRFSNYCDFRNQTFDAVERDEREIYNLSGDERAIPDRYKTRDTDFRNDEDEIVEELIEDIYRQFKRYYF